MPEGLHDDQRFGEFGLSNDEGAARKRASLTADFEAQVAAKRAAKAAHEAEAQDAAAPEAAGQPAAHEDAARTAGQSSRPAPAAEPEQPAGTVDQRAFSDRVAYGDVRHMSKNFYKGLIASIVVVIIVVVAIVILGQASL